MAWWPPLWPPVRTTDAGQDLLVTVGSTGVARGLGQSQLVLLVGGLEARVRAQRELPLLLLGHEPGVRECRPTIRQQDPAGVVEMQVAHGHRVDGVRIEAGLAECRHDRVAGHAPLGAAMLVHALADARLHQDAAGRRLHEQAVERLGQRRVRVQLVRDQLSHSVRGTGPKTVPASEVNVPAWTSATRTPPPRSVRQSTFAVIPSGQHLDRNAKHSIRCLCSTIVADQRRPCRSCRRADKRVISRAASDPRCGQFADESSNCFDREAKPRDRKAARKKFQYQRWASAMRAGSLVSTEYVSIGHLGRKEGLTLEHVPRCLVFVMPRSEGGNRHAGIDRDHRRTRSSVATHQLVGQGGRGDLESPQA